MKQIYAILLFISLLITFSAKAQIVTITKHEPLKIQNQPLAYYPVLSDDGAQMLFTSENHRGLKLYSFANRAVETVSDADGAGYLPVFGNGNTKVFFRENSFVNGRKFTAVSSFNRATFQKKQVIEPSRDLKKVQNYAEGIVAVQGRKMIQKDVAATSKSSTMSVLTSEKKIELFINGICTELQPQGDQVAAYLWASLSPDQKRILYVAAGKGAFICDLKGNVISSLGSLEAPVWYGDQYVIGMQAKDDGHQILSSKLILLSSDGKFSKELTESSSMSMFPSASYKAGKVAYNTLNGSIYVMDLKITQ